eukprot:4963488-Pyramimonas_sp.AAC.1
MTGGPPLPLFEAARSARSRSTLLSKLLFTVSCLLGSRTCPGSIGRLQRGAKCASDIGYPA